MEIGDIDADRLLTSHQAGALLQVNPSSINNWVRSGRIAAFRTPGGHLRIRASDLVRFLASHNMPIPRRLEGALKKRLLIADDDVKLLAGMRRLLKPYRDRIEVALVENGIDALVQIGIFSPHIVLLDVFMPGINGFEVCRRLKSMSETKGVGVIIVSGRIDPEMEKQALRIGVQRCIQKPIKLHVILEELGLGTEATA
jgi:excisionase family DNA binding protein